MSIEVYIAEQCGLCSGCSRAINTVQEKLAQGKKVAMFKEIVHNKNVNAFLHNIGAMLVDDIHDIPQDALAVIRGHGEPPKTYEYFDNAGIEYVDCTCPNVTKIHKSVEKYSSDGYKVIILGKFHKAMHPEIEGTIGWIKTDYYLIEDFVDLEQLQNLQNQKVLIVCQTTFNIDKAKELIEEISKILNRQNCKVVVNESLCFAQRQINASSRVLAEKVDVMIVVGGKNSSNSQELYKHMSTICPSIFIENIKEYNQALKQANISVSQDFKIGITAGASTLKQELYDLKDLIENDYN